MRFLLVAAAALTMAMPLVAQTQPPQTGCTTPEHRQFDFWIGEWAVTAANGNELGRNTIRSIQQGCALEENWVGARGGTGISLNFYERGNWHQLWVANQSNGVLRLTGGIEGGAMVMSGESMSPQGKVLNRIKWEKIDAGKVRQTWDTSRDGGQTWTTTFQGIYTRIGQPSK